MFQTPILLIVFNRPSETKIVFDQIKKIQPKKLYISADGPRRNISGEDEICKQVKFIFNQIDWDCEIMTLYNQDNLGCKIAVSRAIKWFFQNEEFGIVLEDDCVPDLSFFRFCEELLLKYRYDERIGIITGRNENFKFKKQLSYDYSTSGSIWGWASWSRVLDHYSVNDSNILDNFKGNIYEATVDRFERFRLYHQLKWTFCGFIDTWDYQLHGFLKLNSFLYIVPSENLIQNIGFNNQATHTTSVNDNRANMKLNQLSFPLNHPQFLFPNRNLSRKMVRADSNNKFLFLFLVIKFWFKNK
jgi:hypothetical protein